MPNVRDLEQYRRKKESERKKRERDLERWRKLGRAYEQKRRSGRHMSYPSWQPVILLFVATIVLVTLFSFLSSIR